MFPAFVVPLDRNRVVRASVPSSAGAATPAAEAASAAEAIPAVPAVAAVVSAAAADQTDRTNGHSALFELGPRSWPSGQLPAWQEYEPCHRAARVLCNSAC